MNDSDSDKKHDLPKGVFKMRNKYQAKIKVHGKSIFLGTFMYPEDAEEAYKKAAEKYHAINDQVAGYLDA